VYQAQEINIPTPIIAMIIMPNASHPLDTAMAIYDLFNEFR
jgi:hypothetical protein